MKYELLGQIKPETITPGTMYSTEHKQYVQRDNLGIEISFDKLINANSQYLDNIKIFNFMDNDSYKENKVPKGLNYKSGLNATLYPVQKLHKGRLVNVKYYEYKGSDSIVLDVSIVYQEDEVGDAISRVVTRTWYKNDGTASSDVKVTKKYYEGHKRQRERIIRRTNIINKLRQDVVDLLQQGGQTEQQAYELGTAVLTKFKTEIELYKEINMQPLLSAITVDTTFNSIWNSPVAPGVNARQYILSELTI